MRLSVKIQFVFEIQIERISAQLDRAAIMVGKGVRYLMNAEVCLWGWGGPSEGWMPLCRMMLHLSV